MKILLIEDEEGLILTLTDRLESEGFSVTSAIDGEAGLALALAKNFNLIILDVMLPRKNGYDVCRDLRQRNVQTPILMLTAKGETIDKVLGLKLGADDYLTKPFEVMELLARIEALLRRAPNTDQFSDASFEFGDVSIDFRRAEISRSGERVDLSAMEFKLLQFLIEAIVLSVGGGLIGIIIGIGVSRLMKYVPTFEGITTVVTPGSILLAFLFSASVGIFFGYYPARKASRLDPIEALRYE